MGGAFGAYGRNEICLQDFGPETSKRETALKDINKHCNIKRV
jgi:hypothetical protein